MTIVDGFSMKIFGKENQLGFLMEDNGQIGFELFIR
jgi:hypothetical protein